MIVLAGGDVVLPDRFLAGASLLIEGERISDIFSGPHPDPAGATIVDATGTFIVPGFIDVHVHGVDGYDTLDDGAPVAAIADRLPRYGVTAFCPTTVACPPPQLEAVLAQVARLRERPLPGGARVLPAHLESNFINPEYCGAQPASCLRRPPGAGGGPENGESGDFSAAAVLAVVSASRHDVGIVTLAPELPGGLALVRSLVAAGHRVSMGHSGANYDEALAAIAAGARHATHLFNRMPPIGHRAPGLAGAVLASDAVAAELICDGYHVHPAVCQMAIAAKGVTRMMAITDGTAGSGLPHGSTARLGGRRIRVGDHAALLDDGTLAGSTLTMDRVFRNLVTRLGRSVRDAAILCSTTPARELGLSGFGELTEGAVADLVLLDRSFAVVATYVAGRRVYASGDGAASAGAR